MQNEHGIAGDFEQYDDEKEFRRLVRAVKFSKKHFLYFACCNQVPKQNELIADVKKSLKGKKIKIVKFKRRITDLLAELQKRKFDAECEAVFVQGLEYSISSDGKGDENAVIHNLNISRDSFKKYFSCPLFLWLPEYALIKITRHAPDFFSVRSGTFYFSSTPEKVTEQIFQSFTSGWAEISSLQIDEKLKKIGTLESLLAEYQGLHQEKRNKQTEATLLSELGLFYESISEHRKTIIYFKQSLKIFREINDQLNEGKIIDGLGSAYLRLGKYQEAIKYYEGAIKIAQEIGNQQGKSSTLGNLGTIYFGLEEYQKSIECYEQSLRIFRKISNRQGEGIALGSLGNVYDRLAEYQKAIEYYKQSLKISREIHDRLVESNSLGNLGFVHSKLGEYQKAIEHYNQSLKISREIGNRQGEGIILGNSAITYFALGEAEKACGFWKEAISILEAIESPFANNYRQMLEENCES